MEPRRHLSGDLDARGLRFGVVVSRFNRAVTERLLDGALEALSRHGAEEVDVVSVAGVFEVPLCTQRLARSGRYDGIVCLGAVVRGETSHHHYIATTALQGIGEVMLKHEIPVTCGILTTDTMEQALARAGGKAGNKGYEAATAAVEMATLLRGLG